MKLDKLWLAVASLLLLLSASLLRFKTIISGDSLFLENLATDLFLHGGRWSDWKFTAAPSFLPDMLLYFIAYPVLQDAHARIVAVSIAQVLLLAGATGWFARQLSPALSGRALAVLLMAVALVTVAAGSSAMWLYFYSTNNHLAAVLFGMTGLVAALRHDERPAPTSALMLILSVAIGTVSTGLYTLSGTVPALLACALAWLVMRRNAAPVEARGRIVRLAWLVIGGAVLAQLLQKLLVHHRAGGKPGLSLANMRRAFDLFADATVTAFRPDNAYTFAVSVLLAAALLFLAWTGLRRLRMAGGWSRLAAGVEPRLAAAGLLLATSLFVSVFGAVLSGRFGDQFAYRYFAFPLLLAAVLAVVLLDRRWRARHWDAVLLCGSMCIAYGVVDVTRRMTPVASTYPVADCMIDLERALARDGRHLGAGISEFWLGPAVRHYMPSHPPMINTENSLAPFFWVGTIGPLLRPENYPQYRFHFALLDPRNAPGAFDYTADTIGKRLPPPSRVHTCQTGHEVWLYDGDDLDIAVRAAAARYLHDEEIER